MKIFKAILIGIFPILLTIVGVLAIFFGEIDDSPGLMFIGLVLILITTYLNIKHTLK